MDIFCWVLGKAVDALVSQLNRPSKRCRVRMSRIDTIHTTEEIMVNFAYAVIVVVLSSLSLL